MDSRKDLGSRFRRLRLLKGFTVAQLSEATGYSIDKIVKFEDGSYSFNMGELSRLVDAMGADFELQFHPTSRARLNVTSEFGYMNRSDNKVYDL